MEDSTFIKCELANDVRARFKVQCKRAGVTMAEAIRLLIETFTVENETAQAEQTNDVKGANNVCLRS